MDTYERTYSQTLPAQPGSIFQQADTLDDYAIACALAGVPEAAEPAISAPPDTSMDEELALAVHQREQRKLLRVPSSKARRRSKQLRSLLHHLKPTRVIPRVNPLYAPTASYVSDDRSRLLLRLDMYGLQERQVQGDGNCQFRALADQLFYREGRHGEVRQAVVDQLCCHAERYKAFVTSDYTEYVSSMSKLGTWGDHVTLQAAADVYHVGICIVTSFLENCVITISPTVDAARPPDTAEVRQQTEQLKQAQEASAQGRQEQAMQQLQQAPQEADVPQQTQDLAQPTSPLLDECLTLWLSFWAEVHYNSLAPKSLGGDSPDSASEGSSSEDEGGSHRVLGSRRLGRLFGSS